MEDIDDKVMEMVKEKFYYNETYLGGAGYIHIESSRELKNFWRRVYPKLLLEADYFLHNLTDDNVSIQHPDYITNQKQFFFQEYISKTFNKELVNISIVNNYRKFLIIPNRLSNSTGYIVASLDLANTICMYLINKHTREETIIVAEPNLTTFNNFNKDWSDEIKNMEARVKDIDLDLNQFQTEIVVTNHTWVIDDDGFKDSLKRGGGQNLIFRPSKQNIPKIKIL